MNASKIMPRRSGKKPIAFLLLLCSAVSIRAFEIPPGAKEALLVLPGGFKVKAELALTRVEQAKGLMFRKELKEDRGMLFVFADDGKKNFWMKNTYIPLDIVMLDRRLKVLKIFHRVIPARPGQSDLEVSRVSGPGRYVLELAGGTAKKRGLKPGSTIKISFPAKKTLAGK
ncbi:MAG: DUF192 domain-containing protein [Elusimicrobia bacterium]|nr:DUF192 domain-containing protein [Elusimicrobiota bacterium]